MLSSGLQDYLPFTSEPFLGILESSSVPAHSFQYYVVVTFELLCGILQVVTTQPENTKESQSLIAPRFSVANVPIWPAKPQLGTLFP